jgi:3-oxoacyl-(acyl-carrier-protein) synthase
VVITGIGMVTPLGVGRQAHWSATLRGQSALGPPTRLDHPDLPVRVVGEVKEFVPTDHMAKKLVVRTDRNAHFAFAATGEALADAQLDLEQEDRSRVGIVLAANYGGVNYVLDQLVRLHQKGPSFVSAYMAIAWIPSAPAGQLSIFYGISGYTKTVVNDTVGGIDAIGEAYRAIRGDEADVLIAGGYEAALAEASLAGFATFGDICRDAPDPARAYRPFDEQRYGMVVGEGGATVILEEYSRAVARGAPIYAEVVGYAQTTDAVALQHFADDGVQYGRAIRQALASGKQDAADVGLFVADARANARADRAEAKAIVQALGASGRRVPVAAPKALIGNTFAAAGAIDIATTALTLRDRQIPPMGHIERQDSETALDLVVDQARPFEGTCAIVGGRGTSGVNAALVLAAPR